MNDLWETLLSYLQEPATAWLGLATAFLAFLSRRGYVWLRGDHLPVGLIVTTLLKELENPDKWKVDQKGKSLDHKELSATWLYLSGKWLRVRDREFGQLLNRKEKRLLMNRVHEVYAHLSSDTNPASMAQFVANAFKS